MEHGVDFEFRIANFEFEKAWSMGQRTEDRGQRTEDRKWIYRDKAGKARKAGKGRLFRIANCELRISDCGIADVRCGM
jgi:hypothetical protein